MSVLVRFVLKIINNASNTYAGSISAVAALSPLLYRSYRSRTWLIRSFIRRSLSMLSAF